MGAGKTNENSALLNNLVSPTNAAFKTRKMASNLISMVKENRNGGTSMQTESLSKVKNSEKELKEMNSYPSNFNTPSNEKSSTITSFAKNESIYNSPIPSHYNKSNILQSDYLSNSIQEPMKITNTNENNPNTFTQEAISVTTLMNNQNIPIELSNLSVFFPNYDSTKCSSRPIGNISAYGVNTYQGIIRNYNEDRVSIILNIAKPQSFHGTWPKCSFFGIYDGHGGCLCSDFLRDQLHSYVIRDSNFPNDPIAAMIHGFEEAEKDFIKNFALNKNKEVVDRSGSCAIVALIVEDDCYVANVGDSRAVLSLTGGKNMEVLSNDHKPNEEGENKRIIENGGKVYQTQTPAKLLNIPNMITNGNNSNQVLVGPYRVFPGRLSVSRTFGDVEAKIPKYGGIPGVIVATPEIRSFKITNDTDFLVLGCDGIFDQISNKEILDCVWMTMSESTRTKNINTQCALGADMIMKSSLVRRTLDNVTIAIIAFQNFEKVFNETLVNSAKRTETYSPKSSFYLYNVIENKENPILPESNSNHSSEPAIIVYPNKNQNPPVSAKNVKTAGSKKNLNEPTPENKFKLKYLSPTTQKENSSTISKAKLNNWPGATNINYTSNNTNNSTKNTLNKLNKVLSFEVNKKIVLSPKNKIEDVYKTGICFYFINIFRKY